MVKVIKFFYPYKKEPRIPFFSLFMRKHLLKIMDKKVINEEQFRKLVIKEAKKVISEEEITPIVEERKITFDKVESLIKEMEVSNKSISSISLSEDLYTGEKEGIKEGLKPERDLDVLEHNRKKNVNHVNEGEKDKWNRMLNYEVPTDDER